MQEGDGIYLLPADANPKTAEQLKSQGISHEELFRSLKQGVDQNICVGNVLYLVILDTCRESLQGSTVVAGYSPEIHEPLSENRPDHWLLCTSSSRRGVADDGKDGDRNSPFTQALMSDECGLFQPHVPLNQALKLVCNRLARLGEQKPCLMPGHANIPETLCLHPSRDQFKTEEEHFDVFLCYRDGGSDSALAERLRDKLVCCDIKTKGSETRRIRVFLKSEPAPLAAKVQVANALFRSTVILLLVSRETFADIDTLHADSEAKDRLVQLLWKYEMALELFNAGQHTVVPLLIGRESKKYGRNEFETFDESDTHEEFWHLQKMPDLKIKSVVKNALDVLRCNVQCRVRLHDEMFTHDATIPSIIRGRSVKQSIMAFSSADTFTPSKFEGIEDDAIGKVCRELKVIVDSANKKRTRDTCVLDKDLPGAASKMPKGEGAGERKLPKNDQNEMQRPEVLSKKSAHSHQDANEGSSSKRQRSDSYTSFVSSSGRHVGEDRRDAAVGAGSTSRAHNSAIPVQLAGVNSGAAESISDGCTLHFCTFEKDPRLRFVRPQLTRSLCSIMFPENISESAHEVLVKILLCLESEGVIRLEDLEDTKNHKDILSYIEKLQLNPTFRRKFETYLCLFKPVKVGAEEPAPASRAEEESDAEMVSSMESKQPHAGAF